MKALNGFLMTQTDDLDRHMWVCNVRKPYQHSPRSQLLSCLWLAGTLSG